MKPGITRVIENGIKRPIQLLLEHGCYPAALILIYSGMDTMAFLNMPASNTDVMRSDFMAWAARYMKLSCPQQVTAADLYGARCSVLHGGSQSRFTREGRGRSLEYFVGESTPADGTASKELLRVPVEELVAAFFAGIDQFLGELTQDEAKARIAGARLSELLRSLPY